MEVVFGERYSFEEYKTSMDELGIVSPHEVYSYGILKVFFETLLANTDIQVVQVFSNSDTTIHDKTHYSGDKGTSDLLLTRRYIYINKNISSEDSDTEYLASVEAKIPIHGKFDELSFIKANINTTQTKSHLNKTGKVIVTDGIRWYFLVNDSSVDIKESENIERCIVRSFKLKNDSGEWKVEEKEGSQFVKELLGLEEFNYHEHNEWVELQDYIKKFV